MAQAIVYYFKLVLSKKKYEINFLWTSAKTAVPHHQDTGECEVKNVVVVVGVVGVGVRCKAVLRVTCVLFQEGVAHWSLSWA